MTDAPKSPQCVLENPPSIFGDVPRLPESCDPRPMTATEVLERYKLTERELPSMTHGTVRGVGFFESATGDPAERIVGLTQFKGNLIVATERGVWQYDELDEVFRPVKFEGPATD